MKPYTKHLLFGLLLLFAMQHTNAQTEKSKELKAQRKLEKQQVAKEDYQRLFELLSDTSFIFEAHTAYGSRGDVFKLNLLTNFFSLEGEKANLQLAMNSRMGIDGQNSSGRLVKYQLSAKGFKKPLVINGNVEPSNRSGNVPFMLTVFRNGKARLEINPLNAGQYVLEGDVMPLDQSSVYKGMPNFGR